MEKKLIGLFALAAGMILFAGWSSKEGNLASFLQKIQNINQKQELQQKQPPGQKIETSKIGEAEFSYEIARTEEERKIGLTKYGEIPENFGMFFVLDQKGTVPAFWMKGMKFPIDIIWIKDEKVAEITANVPVVSGNPPDKAIKTYSPQTPAEYVFEIAAGEAEKQGIKVGDRVILPKP